MTVPRIVVFASEHFGSFRQIAFSIACLIAGAAHDRAVYFDR